MTTGESQSQRDALVSLYQRMGVVHINPDRGYIVRGLRLSAFYIDGMRISTSPEGLRLVTDILSTRLAGISFDVIAAPSVSGVPYGSVLAERLQKRLAIDRGIPSKYGFHQRIEGEIRLDDRVVIVDDIAKRGETVLEIGEQVRSRGGQLVAALVVVDATGPAERDRLQQAGMSVEGLISLRDLGVNPNLQLDANSQA